MFFNVLVIVACQVPPRSILKLKKSCPVNKVMSREPCKKTQRKLTIKMKLEKRSKTAYQSFYDFETSINNSDIQLVDIDDEARSEFVAMKKLFDDKIITWHERTIVRIIIMMRSESRKREKIIDTFAERYGDSDYYKALDGLNMMKEGGLFNTRMRRVFSRAGLQGETKRRPIIWLDMNKEWQLWSYSCEFGYHKRYLLLDCLRRSGVLYEAIKVVHDAIFFPLHYRSFLDNKKRTFPEWSKRITGEKHQKWLGDGGTNGKAPTALQLKWRHQKRRLREKDRRLGIKRCA